MAIAIIGGTGNLGYGLALRLAKLGDEVIIGSRGLEKAEAAAQEANAAAGVMTIRGLGNPDATAAAEVIVIAVPAAAQEGTLQSIAAHVAGKLVIDTTVCLAEGDPTLVISPPEGSAAERAAALLPGARVVSALHTVSGKLLASLEKPVNVDIFVAGDDKATKEEAMALLGRIGGRCVDAGPLRQSSTLERLTALCIGMNIRYKKRHIGLSVHGL